MDPSCLPASRILEFLGEAGSGTANAPTTSAEATSDAALSARSSPRALEGDAGLDCRLSRANGQSLLGEPGYCVLDEFLGQGACCELCCLVRERGTNDLRDARMGKAVQWQDGNARGDKLAWVTQAWDKERSLFSRLFAALKILRSSATLAPFRLGDKVSVQLACYPGEATSGYVRHADVDLKQCAAGEERRVLTALFYLNPGWDTETNGGSLRVFGAGTEQPRDICPSANRLVVFRSELEHQVLPTRKRPRWAITCWFYGMGLSERVPRSRRPPGHRPCDKGAIFVAIPAFRDPQCQHTIRDLYARAANPERIWVGVCWQLDLGADAAACLGALCGDGAARFAHRGRVRSVLLPAADGKGPCVARSLAQSLWQGEEFLLNIDSHMRFAERWDARLVDMLDACTPTAVPSRLRDGGGDSPPFRPVLTTYPSGFSLGEGNASGERAAAELPRATLLGVAGPPVLEASHFDERDGVLRLVSRRHDKRRAGLASGPLPSAFWAAGFNFARACDVLPLVSYPREGEHLFFGEETLVGTALWVRGCDFFAPSDEVVFHLWSRAYRPDFASTTEQRLEASRRVAAFFRGGAQGSLFGVELDSSAGGVVRSLAEYEALSRVHFKTAQVE